MKNIITDRLEQSINVKKRFIESNIDLIEEGGNRLASCIASGHKILIFGNGGSAADAQHITAEFVNRFEIERNPLAALALTTDTSVITSIGNDYDFEDIFAKQIMALGKKGDVAIGISTSGNSKNVVKAALVAKNMGIFTIGLTGYGGRMADHADMIFAVQSKTTARIQETHILLGHILCDLVDRILFPEHWAGSRENVAESNK
jgi:D-sedoheptulose 7-phosphate isomerase